jgi:hypothetical protein
MAFPPTIPAFGDDCRSRRCGRRRCGLGADLFDSFVGSIVAAMVLGVAYDTRSLVILPVILAGIGIAASIAGMRLVRIEEGGDPSRALTLASLAAGVLMVALAYPFARLLVPGVVAPVANVTGTLHVLTATGIFMATISGLLAGIAVGLATEFYTAAWSETGATGTGGLTRGMISTAWPVVFLVGAIVVAFFFAGLYGIAIASVGMLSTIGIQLAWPCSRRSSRTPAASPTGAISIRRPARVPIGSPRSAASPARSARDSRSVRRRSRRWPCSRRIGRWPACTPSTSATQS